MSLEIELVLRIPKPKEPVKDGSGYPIDSASFRFIKRVTVERVPKVDDSTTVTFQGNPHGVKVTRVDWSESDDIFKVSCQYAKKSILQADYLALMQDAEWAMKPLF